MAGLNLPPYLEVRYTASYGRGIFTTKPVKRGTKLFSSDVYTFGVGGLTTADVSAVCHHCLTETSDRPVLCNQCKIIGYCSRRCLKAALPLHAMECKGIKEVEKYRGLDVNTPSWPSNYTRYWPPKHALLVARVINKRILDDSDRWIGDACYADTLPPAKAECFPYMEKFVRHLVPHTVSNQDIIRAFHAVSINTAEVNIPNDCIAVVAVQNLEYLLLNHMCKPNCERELEENGALAILAMEDLPVGKQLGISYLHRDYLLNFREIRRSKLMQSFGFQCNCHTCNGELETGSKLWLLEQQKHSLIVPWSRKVARKTMIEAWDLLTEARITPDITPKDITDLLESSFKSLLVILDKRNVMVVLTAITLILNFNVSDESQKAVDVFEQLGCSGTASIIDYGSTVLMSEVMGNICVCLFNLGRVKQFRSAFSLTQELHIKQPCSMALCDMLGLIPEFTDEEIEEFKKDVYSAVGEDIMLKFLSLLCGASFCCPCCGSEEDHYE